MKRKHITFVLAIIVLAACTAQFIVSKKSMEHARVIIHDQSIAVTVADTDKERVRGLGGAEHLDSREGMLFVFPATDNYQFWMKDMLFSIDIVWIDSNWQVVHVEHGVSPDTYPATFGAGVLSQYVLEVSAGVAAELGIREGDNLRLVN